MKAVVTGANGTVGKVLCSILKNLKHEIVPWDRTAVPPNDPQAMKSFLEKVRPDIVYHLAIASRPIGLSDESRVINCDWPAHLASLTKSLNIRFVHASTAMVFSDNAKGPFILSSKPDATQGYGYEKRIAEERALVENPGAVIARLGWQIGDAPGSNNMLDFFASKMKEHSEIRASTRWFPACSFLQDTADGLTRLADSAAGIYMLDSNQRWTFFEIAGALNALHGNKWKVVPTEDFVFDQRMQDERAKMPALNKRLTTLR